MNKLNAFYTSKTKDKSCLSLTLVNDVLSSMGLIILINTICDFFFQNPSVYNPSKAEEKQILQDTSLGIKLNQYS